MLDTVVLKRFSKNFLLGNFARIFGGSFDQTYAFGLLLCKRKAPSNSLDKFPSQRLR